MIVFIKLHRGCVLFIGVLKATPASSSDCNMGLEVYKASREPCIDSICVFAYKGYPSVLQCTKTVLFPDSG